MASLHKKSLIATAAIFCCRFTGLLRELVYTALFGATGALDAFLTAFRVPNMLRDMFAEGALSQSFTSVMSKVVKQEGEAAAWQLANRVFSQFVSFMVCVVAAGVLLSGFFMQQLYPARAQVQLQAPEGVPTAVAVQATYLGCTGEEGQRRAEFSAAAPLQGAGQGACVRVDSAEALQPGQQVLLYTSTKPPAGYGGAVLKVQEHNFLQLAADLCRIMWPFILLASVSALCMGALNVFGVFGLPNLASAAFNLTVVAVGSALGYWIDPNFGPASLYGFAVAVVLGGCMQVLVQVPKLRRLGFRPQFDFALAWQMGRLCVTDARVRRIWWLMVPGVIAAGITQLNIFINTSFALYLQDGSVTALSSAFHLWQLPVALFGVAVGMVVLPSVSQLSMEKGGQQIPQQLAMAMRFMCFFAVPSAVVLGLWGVEIVSVFYQRGRFDAAASVTTGQVLAAYSLGLLGYAGTKVLQPVFIALERAWVPAGLALMTAAISVSCNYVFVQVLHMPVHWLALTTALVTTLTFAFYFLYLRRLLGNMAGDVLMQGLVRILAAGAVLAAVCWLCRAFVFPGFTSWSFRARLFTLALCGAGAGLIYLIAAYLCRVPELRTLTSRLRRH